MQIEIADDTIQLALVTLAAAERVSVSTVVVHLLVQALALPSACASTALPPVPRQTAIDRNAALVLTTLKNNTGGLTIHDICGITGWCYMTGRKVMRHMVEQGLVDRERIPTCGAPAWAYTARLTAVPVADPAADTATPAADVPSSLSNGDLTLL